MGTTALLQRLRAKVRRSIASDSESAAIEELQRQLDDMNVGLQGMIGSMRNELHRDLQRVRDEADAVRGHLDQRIVETSDAVIRHAATHAQEVTDLAANGIAARVARVERDVRLNGASGQDRLSPDRSSDPGSVRTSRAPTPDAQIDQPPAYAAFEEEFRGPSSLVRQIQSAYLDDIHDLPAENLPVLDVGCGRGEFVRLLSEAGVAAYGVDLNRDFVDDARQDGIDLRLEHGADHLGSLPDQSIRALIAFHLVEHLPFRALVELLNEAFRVLAPGGLVLLETPNPENLAVGANRFWLDPTHIRPIPPMLLAFLVREAGFDPVEVRRLHPLPDIIDPSIAQDRADAAIIRTLNEVLAGPIDYSVLGRRP